jgi:hypothetical protein
LLRALLRALVFAAILETLFYRLLTIPSESSEWPWLADIHLSTGRAGRLMFFIAFVILLPALVSLASGALRYPAWPIGLNGLVVVGILTLAALAISLSTGPRGPAFALGFGIVALLTKLLMLAGMFESRKDNAGRLFAVALGGSLLCMTAGDVVDLTGRLSVTWLPAALGSPSTHAGRWLLFAAGILAFFAFAPRVRGNRRAVEHAAAFGLPTATAFTLILGVVFHLPLLRRVGPGLGAVQADSVTLILTTGTAAAALFLVTMTAFRGLIDPYLRPRGYGLLFILLAGYPNAIAYEHLLSLMGVALLTAESFSRASRTAEDPSFASPGAGSTDPVTVRLQAGHTLDG